MRSNPIDGFEIDPATIQYIGHDLQRPECILAEPDGSLWSADARGGVVHIAPDGSQRVVTQSFGRSYFETAGDGASRFVEGTLPNGLAFTQSGDILISNFGTDRLEVMSRDGDAKILHDKIDGKPIGKVNFVLRDRQGRIWLTISTMMRNWMDASVRMVKDGYLAMADERGLRIIADGFAFTNEIRFDEQEEWLYVAETTGMKVTRLRIRKDGSVAERQTFGPETHGAFIDGIAFDDFGNLWGTHIMTDRIFAITPKGDLRILLDDDRGSQPGKALLDAFERGEATPEMMMKCGGTIAPWMASLTFGGPDLRNVYIGSLRGTRIPWFRSPSAGLAMVHWR